MSHPKSLLQLDTLEISQIEQFIFVAEQIALKKIDVSSMMSGRILCPVFLQESSRTYMNSVAAFLRMNGSILPIVISNTRFGSAWAEPAQDFCTLLNSCCDFAIVRSPDTVTAHAFQEYCEIPVINAGNGMGRGAEHPIQGLVDLFTIRQEFGAQTLDILMIGGKHIRTTRTQIKLFQRFGHRLTIMSPPSPIDNDDIDILCRTSCVEIHSLDEVNLEEIDIIYHNGMDEDAAATVGVDYILTLAQLQARGFRGRVMHSLPRKEELSSCIDNSPYNLYFSQMRNSRFVIQSVFQIQA